MAHYPNGSRRKPKSRRWRARGFSLELQKVRERVGKAELRHGGVIRRSAGGELRGGADVMRAGAQAPWPRFPAKTPVWPRSYLSPALLLMILI
jgi:hypothetical protein